MLIYLAANDRTSLELAVHTQEVEGCLLSYHYAVKYPSDFMPGLATKSNPIHINSKTGKPLSVEAKENK